jgi:protease I
MSRFRLIVLTAVTLVFIVCCSPAQQSTKRVLLILRDQSDNMDLMLTKEVGVMKSMLEEAGYKVITASQSGQTLKGSSTTLKPDLKLADVKVDNYAGVMLPCMADDLGTASTKEAFDIVKKAVEQGKPVAAQTTSVYILEDAGVLKGKRFALPDSMAYDITDGIQQDSGVVQDGNIITSAACPNMELITGGWYKDGTSELTQKFIDALKSAH